MSAAILIRHEGSGAVRNVVQLFGLALFALSAAAAAADDDAKSAIEARYQRERAACDSGPPSVDRTACLRDAAAARDEARRGLLNGARNGYDQNALARCEALPPEERDNCRRRARGEGETRGSVSEGGVFREYRELTIEEPAPSNGKDGEPLNRGKP